MCEINRLTARLFFILFSYFLSTQFFKVVVSFLNFYFAR